MKRLGNLRNVRTWSLTQVIILVGQNSCSRDIGIDQISDRSRQSEEFHGTMYWLIRAVWGFKAVILLAPQRRPRFWGSYDLLSLSNDSTCDLMCSPSKHFACGRIPGAQQIQFPRKRRHSANTTPLSFRAPPYVGALPCQSTKHPTWRHEGDNRVLPMQ